MVLIDDDGTFYLDYVTIIIWTFTMMHVSN